MKFPQHILVIVSGKRKEPIALARALQLAQFYDIKLSLFSCVYDPGTDLSPLLSNPHKKAIKNKKLQNRLEYLDSIKESLASSGIPITTHVLWHRKVQNAVMEICDELSPDLVIKRISDNANSINPFTMPMDWQLLRQCPSPLLIVKDKEWRMPAPVLAAVNVGAEHTGEKEFNQQIIAYAKLLSRLTDAPAEVVTTHITPMVDEAMNIPGFDPVDLKQKVTQFNQERLAEMVKESNISPDKRHVIEGLAEDRIPELANKINAQLVVMGVSAQKGLKNAFMGNTAERVLTHLQCEVLALKP